jgi:hypothetical protein
MYHNSCDIVGTTGGGEGGKVARVQDDKFWASRVVEIVQKIMRGLPSGIP